MYSKPNVTSPLPGSSQNHSLKNQDQPSSDHNQYPSDDNQSQYLPSDGWMSIPQVLPQNSPNGLEYLSTLDQLLVIQEKKIIEALFGFESNNIFTIKNRAGQKVFYAVEDNDCCTRNFMGTSRPFEMRILDNYNNEVIHLSKPLGYQPCCFTCCLQRIEVFSPPGCLVGIVEQDLSILTPIFTIRNAANEEVFKMKGPILCRYNIWSRRVGFKVLSKNKTTIVGRISKKSSGIFRELFLNADDFGITFPMDLDVRMKAVILGACFLIDLMFYEH